MSSVSRPVASRVSEPVIRVFEEGDGPAVLALHNRAFAGHPTRSARHFDWKYRRNPSGRGEPAGGASKWPSRPMMTVAMAANGRCLGVYSVVPQRVVLNGEVVRAGLQTDMAVDATQRTGLGGSRLILALGRLYRERFVDERMPLEWGFPEPALQRVCIKHLGVGVLRDVVFLARDVASLEGCSPAELEVRRPARFAADADELWRRVAPEHGAATLRDAAHLNWRYLDHPDVDYVPLEVRQRIDGRLRGIAITRAGGWDPCLLSIMEWIVPGEDHEAETALLERVLREARRRERSHVVAWFPCCSPAFHRFQVSHGFFAKGTPYQECYRSRVRGVDRRWLDQHWFQTMGDMEFF